MSHDNFQPPDVEEDREAMAEAYWDAQLMRAYAEGRADESVRSLHFRAALELIATPMRPDGTWNRDRAACQQLAAEALQR